MMNFGKHRKQTHRWVFDNDKSYVKWALGVDNPSGALSEFIRYAQQRESRLHESVKIKALHRDVNILRQRRDHAVKQADFLAAHKYQQQQLTISMALSAFVAVAAAKWAEKCAHITMRIANVADNTRTLNYEIKEFIRLRNS